MIYVLSAPREVTVDRAEIDTPMGKYSTSADIAAKFKAFLAETHMDYTGTIGGQYTYSFSNTSLGLILVVEDCVSRQRFDATDYDSW
jgi:hypothetical protein